MGFSEKFRSRHRQNRQKNKARDGAGGNIFCSIYIAVLNSFIILSADTKSCIKKAFPIKK